MSCITVEASMKLTSKISIRYDELYFAGVWVISPVRRFPRRRISSRTPWSRVDPKPFSLDLWCFRTTLWLWTWIVKLVRRFFFAKFILLCYTHATQLLSFLFLSLIKIFSTKYCLTSNCRDIIPFCEKISTDRK